MEKIVVGIDGSETAQQALEWAVAEARLRGARLVVVHTWPQPTAALLSPYPHSWRTRPRWRRGTTNTDRQRGGSRPHGAPAIPNNCSSRVPPHQICSQPHRTAPCSSSGHADGLGSVSQQVAHEATIPVVIIPPAANPTGGHSSRSDG
ncbi:universal stress protein [Kribbella sp. NPDC023972]|uniref:universal stress protein n=1 Tax=Kribbella sp. NPDC023972 TaxID=3154795 RepID=UPI003403A85D